MPAFQQADAVGRETFPHLKAALSRGEWDSAYALAVDLLERRITSGSPFEAAEDRELIEWTADLALLFGEAEAADKLLEVLEGLCLRDQRVFVGDYAALKRANLAVSRGEFGECRRILESLEPRIGPLEEVPWDRADFPAWEDRCHWPEARIDRPLILSRLYHIMGLWLSGNGHYGHACEVLKRGLDQARPPASSLASRAEVPLALALATARFERGELDESRCLVKALKSRFTGSELPVWTIQSLELLAHLDLLAGNFGAALERLSQASRACAAGKFPSALLKAKLTEAGALISLNQVARAEEILNWASEQAESLADVSALRRIAQLYRYARARAETPADAVAPSVTAIWHGADESPVEPLPPHEAEPFRLPPSVGFLDFFEDRGLEVLWLLSKGNVPEADDRLDELRTQFEVSDSGLIQLRLHVLAGMVAYSARDYRNADRIFAEVCPHFERLKLLPELWQALRLREWCALRQGVRNSELAELHEQVKNCRDQLANSLAAVDRAIWGLNQWMDEERDLADRCGQLARERRERDAAPWWKRPWLTWKLWKTHHDLLSEIESHIGQRASKEIGKDQANGELPKPASLWQRLIRHPRRAATLSFLSFPDWVFVTTSRRFSLDFHFANVSRLCLRELVKNWHLGISRSGANEDLRNVATDLSKRLGLSEVLHRLPRETTRLFVNADDGLHGFPFAAMDHAGHPLVDQFALTVTYHSLPTPCNNSSRIPSRKVVVAAVSRGNDNQGIDSLPQVLPEAKQVAEWWQRRNHDVIPLHDGEASRHSLLDALKSARFGHIACHGLFQAGRPQSTGLVLLPGAGEPEILSLEDLARADLSGLELVTLSSCWQADNFVFPGRWIVSLPETLWRAGARQVLACLWPVDDQVARYFVARFYQHLETHPADVALQKTQQDCRNNQLNVPRTRDGDGVRDLAAGPAGSSRLDGSRTNAEPSETNTLDHDSRKYLPTSSPFYWAGFRLHGSPSFNCPVDPSR
jgi:CHAT domain-containing protein